jgi:hypothetical protein
MFIEGKYGLKEKPLPREVGINSLMVFHMLFKTNVTTTLT